MLYFSMPFINSFPRYSIPVFLHVPDAPFSGFIRAMPHVTVWSVIEASGTFEVEILQRGY